MYLTGQQNNFQQEVLDHLDLSYVIAIATNDESSRAGESNVRLCGLGWTCGASWSLTGLKRAKDPP